MEGDSLSPAPNTVTMDNAVIASSAQSMFYEDIMSPPTMQSNIADNFFDTSRHISDKGQVSEYQKCENESIFKSVPSNLQESDALFFRHITDIATDLAMPQDKTENFFSVGSTNNMVPSNMSLDHSTVISNGHQQQSAAAQNNMATDNQQQETMPSLFAHQDYSSLMGMNDMFDQARKEAGQNQVLPLPAHIVAMTQVPRNNNMNVPFNNTHNSFDSQAVTPPSLPTERKVRFYRTRDALEKSGLMGVTMKTADLLKNNDVLDKEIQKLKKETEQLLQAILNNPENERFQKSI